MHTSLLEKNRRINHILQKSMGQDINYFEIAQVLKNVIEANVYIVKRDAQIFGYALLNDFECDILIKEVLNKGFFPSRYNSFLIKEDEPRVNLKQKKNRCVFLEDRECLFSNKVVSVVPILGGAERLGTLLLARFGRTFDAEDLVLAETGATVVGMEILREASDKLEEEARRRAVVHLALGTLSFSEREAIDHILRELEGDEGTVVASRIADRLRITRSVIVNALRKFESAGLIESRSLGMKGTYIKVLNNYLLKYLREHDITLSPKPVNR